MLLIKRMTIIVGAFLLLTFFSLAGMGFLSNALAADSISASQPTCDALHDGQVIVLEETGAKVVCKFQLATTAISFSPGNPEPGDPICDAAHDGAHWLYGGDLFVCRFTQGVWIWARCT